MNSAQNRITDEFVLHRLRYENVWLEFDKERLDVFDVAKVRQIKKAGSLFIGSWGLLSNHEISNMNVESEDRFTCFGRNFDYSSKTMAKDCPLTYAFLKGGPLRVTGNRIQYIPEPGTDTKEHAFRAVEYLFRGMYLTSCIDESLVKAYVDENTLDITFEKDSKEPLYITFDVVYQLAKPLKIPREKITFQQYRVTASYLAAILALFEEPEKWVVSKHFGSCTPKDYIDVPRLKFMDSFTKQFTYEKACSILAKFPRYAGKAQDLLSFQDFKRFGRSMQVYDSCYVRLHFGLIMAHIDAKDFDVFMRRSIQKFEQGIATLQKGEFPKFEAEDLISLDTSSFDIERQYYRYRWTEEETRNWEAWAKKRSLEEMQKLIAAINGVLRNFKAFMEIYDTDLAETTRKYFPRAKKVRAHDAILQMLADDIEVDPLTFIDGNSKSDDGYYDPIKNAIQEFASLLVV